jgi:hypothetical protein
MMENPVVSGMNGPALEFEPSQQRRSRETSIGWREAFFAAACAIALAWMNLYISRDLIFAQTAPMASMHGFWAAIARWAGGSWFGPEWWPYWDCGIPFEFTYAPAVPALTALIAAIFHLTHNLAFQSVTVLAYCLAPVTLFLMAWLWTRSPGYSFLAGLFYSLTGPTRILVPDDVFLWRIFGDARRFYLVSVWDETPHVLALGFLPLAILFLSLSIRKRRLVYHAAAAVSIAAATLTSAFGPTMVAMAAFCLLFVLRRQDYKRNILLTVAIGAYAYALSARFLPPTLLNAIRIATGRGEDGNWTLASLTALAIMVLGWIVLWRYLPRWTSDWRLQFFALFAYLTSSPPILATFLSRHLLPQPNRYKFEMELAIALLVVFGARYWIERTPRAVKAALLFLFLALAGEQVESYRRYARAIIPPGDLLQTIEYRAATWAAQNLPGVRMAMPGSVAQWTNAFTQVPQFTGGSWSMAYNPIQQRGFDAELIGGDTPEEDARVSLAWLKAYGVGAVCVSGPKSPEYWKPFRHPGKFDGVLPVLWRADDTTIYRIPQRTASLAHVVSESAVIRHSPRRPSDKAGIERYVAALDDPSLPPAEFHWEGRNRILIQTVAQPDQAISVQVSYHPGWHVTVGNRHPQLRKDGLGLIWFRPECDGPCVVRMDYDGGWELRLCRWVCYLALAGLLFALPVWFIRHRRRPEPATR